MHAAWQLDRPERVRALARFTALTPSHPSSACEPPTTITTAQPGSLIVRCAPARHWPSSGPAAHYVKGPRAPCHSVHLPSCRPESRIREERDTNTRHSLLALCSKLNREMPDKRCTINVLLLLMWVVVTLKYC